MFSVSLASVCPPDLLLIAINVIHLPLGISIGANREVKKAVEGYWAGKISADDLTKVALEVKKTNWNSLKERGVELIPRFVSCDPHART